MPPDHNQSETPAAETSPPDDGPTSREHSEPDRSPAQPILDTIRSQIRRRLPLLLVIAMLATVLAAAAAVLVQQRLDATPDWWQPIPRGTPEIIQTAVDVENGLTNAITQQRALERRELPGVGEVEASKNWGIRLASHEASAWLNERLPKWAEAEGWLAEWPERLDELRLMFDGTRIRLGAKFRSPTDPEGSYLSAILDPQFRADGTLWLPADGVAIGRLGLPPRWVFNKKSLSADDSLPEEFQDEVEAAELQGLMDMFSGSTPGPEPLIRLADGRRVRLLNITTEPERGTVLLTFRTEHHKK